MKVMSGEEVAGGQKAATRRPRPRVRLHANIGDMIVPSPDFVVQEWHDYFLGLLHRWSIPAMRLALGLVFLWFGALKLFGASPVINILEHTYWFLPVKSFSLAIGAWEVLIGACLMSKRALRCALGLLCLHLAGTFLALAFAPVLFFQDGNLLRLTVEGEFVVKNMVLIAAALVIAGHEIKPFRGRETATNDSTAYK
jgi:putative oxidoreductase